MGRRPSGSQAAILYAGLYAMALGVGGVKATLPAHGADQLDHSNQRLISAFFNWFFFSLCTGGLISVTLMIWIEENLGWNWSFQISVIVLSVTLFIFTIGFSFYRYKLPGGSPLSRIFKVLEMSPEREEYVDWRGKNADPRKHGGVRAASFVCVVEVLENLVFLSNASNFVVYFLMSMNYKPAEASNMVTNFMGTSFLLTIFGGFISDSFITRFKTFIFFCSIELLGLILLTVQAHEPHLHPTMGRRPSGSQAAILYAGLYAMALGVGGVKATLPAHGADQLDHSNQRLISAFFNWFFFSLCTGGLISVTLMIWIEENLGWNWSFQISVIVLSVTLFIFTIGFSFYRYKLPGGSPLSRIFKFVRIFGNQKAKMFLPIRRIGLGLALASGSMAVAAIVEVKRREAAENNVTLSVFWLGWQYLLLGVSDMLTLGGMLEFFYSEAPDSMRSMSTALSWCSTSMGYFLSSVLVGITNSVSGKYGQPWLGGENLNQTRLDLFYTLLSILNILNLLAYIYCAKRY
nr:protein nrt1/ ptr family 4.2 [Quercus suber]